MIYQILTKFILDNLSYRKFYREQGLYCLYVVSVKRLSLLPVKLRFVRYNIFVKPRFIKQENHTQVGTLAGGISKMSGG